VFINIQTILVGVYKYTFIKRMKYIFHTYMMQKKIVNESIIYRHP